MMGTATKVFIYQARNVLRGRSVAGYALFLAAGAWGLVHFGGGVARALPSTATLVVLVVPLCSLLITTTFAYQSSDFIELLLSHPVGRKPLFAGLYLGLTLPLLAAFVLGLGAPLALGGAFSQHAGDIGLLVLSGMLLTAVFTSIGFLIALRVEEPAKGGGIALLIWLALAVLYDGAVLFAAYRWAAYPLEAPMLALMAFNPIDVARMLIMMALDASALMGYTGAVFQDFFGGAKGLIMAVTSLALWIFAPGYLALRTFVKKDF